MWEQSSAVMHLLERKVTGHAAANSVGCPKWERSVCRV